ncbi:MAG: hypothetical protein PVH50_05550, partial [Anaerolineae bacterium]
VPLPVIGYNGSGMDDPWMLFLLLSVFHVVGAAVLASALRQLWSDLVQGDVRGCRTIFLVGWATLFGCLPFAISSTGGGGRTRLLLAGEIVVWMSAFLVVLLAQDVLKEVLQPLLNHETLLMLFGGGLAVAGLATASLTHVEERLGVLLTAGVSVLVGGAIFAYGLWMLMRSTR